ncbi:glycosyltransferase [Enterococcus faecium]|uniref:glycosyltransferase n=1 Tax=Enterococcus faecium TaxID=1352 RepID=UPI001F050C63|nr:glycosyltransferase [Enterococcus faecium]MCH1661865.1 glycosyltransferase [Enterococcus faecium]WDW18507.1 glycosyltransferase [Enterococcus faecium]
MKKICIFDTVEFKKNGVSETIMNILSENEKRKNCEFTLVITGEVDSYYLDILSRYSLKVITLSNRKKEYFHFLKQTKDFFKSNTFDLIHIHTNNALSLLDLYAIGKSKKIVQCHQDKTDHPIVHSFMKPFFNRSFDFGIAVGPETSNLCFEKENFVLLPNPIDTDKFLFSESERKTYRKQMGYKNSDIVLLSVGRLEDQKNYEYELKVFEQLVKLNENYQLLIIGDGSKRDYLENLVSSNNIKNVKFIFSVDNVTPYYSMSDLFLLLSQHEALGLVVIEAQINGLVSISSSAVPKMAVVSEYFHYMDIHSTFENSANYIDKIVYSTKIYSRANNKVDARIHPYEKSNSYVALIAIYDKILKNE